MRRSPGSPSTRWPLRRSWRCCWWVGAGCSPTTRKPPSDLYFVRYAAEDILNWRFVVEQGVEKLAFLVLRECYHEPDPEDPFVQLEKERYRVYQRTQGVDALTATVTVTLWWKTEHSQQQGGQEVWTSAPPILLTRRGANLTEIPFAFVPDTRMRKPPLLDLVNTNLSLYRTSADLEHGRHFTALPQPYVTGTTLDGPAGGSLSIGSGNAWVIGEEAARVGMLEFTGQGLGALENAEERKKKSMAVLGARMLEEQPVVDDTATAVLQRQAGEMSVLQSLSLKCGAAFTRSLQWLAWWHGTTNLEADPKIVCTFNQDFVSKAMDGSEFSALSTGYTGGAISFEIWWYALLKGERVPPGWTKEDEQGALKKEAEERSERAVRESLAIGGEQADEKGTGFMPPVPPKKLPPLPKK